jgi:hypothetical protein
MGRAGRLHVVVDLDSIGDIDPNAVAAMAVVVATSGLLSGCGETKAVYPDSLNPGDHSAPTLGQQKHETIFGPSGLFGDSGKNQNGSGEVGVGVNSFLWRASLDTLAFMPLASADPFGGTILTDWYELPGTHDQRFKLNVFIVDRALRADGVKVSVFKQVRGADGQWKDTAVSPKMATEIEDAILTRARQLRIVSQ